LRASFLQTHPLRTRLSIIEHPKFDLSIRIAFFRGRYLGTREQVALELQRILVKHFRGASEAPLRVIRRIVAGIGVSKAISCSASKANSGPNSKTAANSP
jgi:hypothetical protein